MKKRIFFVLAIFFFLIFSKSVYADTLCSTNGYTISAINGIFTDEEGARDNQRKLRLLLKGEYKGESLDYQYLYNPSHLAGISDLIDVLQQGVLGEVSDYDLVEMINDASDKIKTQKVLLVAHSQGNFYANNFYEQLASEQGGVPEQSLGVYGVASPARYVAGNGRYLTSDTDSVIAETVASYIEILPPNIHIPIDKNVDGNGHSFSDVYLKYQSGRVISDIKYALSKLRENDEQEPSFPCISKIETSSFHRIKGAFFFLADPMATLVGDGIKEAYKIGLFLTDRADKVGSFIGKNLRNLLAGAGESLDEDILTSRDPSLVLLNQDDEKEENKDKEEAKETEKNKGNEIKVVFSPEPLQNTQLENQKEIISTKNKIHRSGGSGGVKEEESPVIVDPEPEPDVDPEDPEPVDPEPEDPEPDQEDEPKEDNLSFSDLNNNQIADSEEDDVEVVSAQFLLPGEYSFENLILSNNSLLTLKGDPSSPNDFKGVKIYAKNIIVENGSHISADKEGHGPLSGPGAGEKTEWGGSYGGTSIGNLEDKTYGSAVEPIDLGSGGAPTHSGGGAMYFVVSGVFDNDGEVSADGDRSSSGGSIYIDTKKLSGNGIFRATGGGLYFADYFKSPGGGGRIAIYYDESSFTGGVEAKGGCGSYDGWTSSCSEDGTVGLFDEINNDIYVFGNSWRFISDDAPFSFKNIYFDEGTKVTSDDGVSIDADYLFVDGGSRFTLAQDQVLNIKNITIDGGSYIIFSGSESLDVESIDIKGDSEISVVAENILLIEAQNLFVEEGSKINTNALGYGILSGPGAPSLELGGASHGGLGHLAESSSIYGSKEEPEDFGSGGRGNHTRGGGVVKLIIDNVFKNDGLVSANGDTTSSGGSIYIKTKNFEGSGLVSAKGGTSYCPGICYGPGGGGRIAIYYDESSFTGSTSVAGYIGWGGASEDGTIYTSDGSVTPDPDPEPDPNTPSVVEYKLNGNREDLTTNNPPEEPIILSFTANKNVLWVSIKIENEDDSSMYKYFYPGDDCDNKNTCTETWTGNLSGGGDLIDGVYKIKIHLKDTENREFDDYLSPYGIVVETTSIEALSLEQNIYEVEEPEGEIQFGTESEDEIEIEVESEQEMVLEIEPAEDQGKDLDEQEIPPEV